MGRGGENFSDCLNSQQFASDYREKYEEEVTKEFQRQMKVRIVGFRQDEAGEWIVDLECGHSQHIRHNPPWTERAWVLSPEGRAAHLGGELECRKCDSG
jgi:hypothetical protein